MPQSEAEWCAGQDLNLHRIAPNSPSNCRVCQFHHPRKQTYYIKQDGKYQAKSARQRTRRAETLADFAQTLSKAEGRVEGSN